MNFKRKSGILAHITSFPSKYGIGDLGRTTYKFIDFLHDSGQMLWQILPLGPTSFKDSPYQCFSTFAGNHLLIDFDELITNKLLTEDDVVDVPSFSCEKVEYGEVIKYKNKVFKTAYDNFLKLDDLHSYKRDFDEFDKKSSWLLDYSLFMALKYYFINERSQNADINGYEKFKTKNKNILTENQINDFYYGAVWFSWDDAIVKRDKATLLKWQDKLSYEIGYYKFLQFEFFRQWEKVKLYANSKDIEIIGDIPIFVALDSVDVWVNKSLFYLDEDCNPIKVAGVPPDYFSETGQLWGNPLYDWSAHKKEGYSWWIERVKSMLDIVDIIRIDHFRAFDEYYAIPYGEKTAVNGKWEKGPKNDLFVAIKKSLGDLPIIAEDLGVMTDTVEQLRDTLGFPGMKILQFAFTGKNDNDYLPHNFNTCNCVAYTGTHDNNTSIGWYNESPEIVKDHVRRYMNVSGDNIAFDMIRLLLSSTANFAIIPIQDVLQLDSEFRMNTPGTSEGNWQFKFKQAMLSSDLTEQLSYLTKLFNRQGNK